MTNFTDTQLERMKIPPHSIEAEQSVLGSLMMDNSCYEIIGDQPDQPKVSDAEDFSDDLPF